MSSIQLQNILKSFGETKVLRDVSLEIYDGEFTALVGPSGCGKSTLLRILAGLEDLDDGSVRIDNIDVSEASASERNLSMVFQSYALYPHLTVRENIAVPLRMRELNSSQRLPFFGSFLTPTPIKQNISDKITAAAKMLEIDHLLERNRGSSRADNVSVLRLVAPLFASPKPFSLMSHSQILTPN